MMEVIRTRGNESAEADDRKKIIVTRPWWFCLFGFFARCWFRDVFPFCFILSVDDLTGFFRLDRKAGASSCYYVLWRCGGHGWVASFHVNIRIRFWEEWLGLRGLVIE